MNLMKLHPSVVFRPHLSMFFFAMICLSATAVRADNLPPARFRGHIVAVNLEEKTITVNTRSGEVTAVWDDESDIRSPERLRTFDRLKPGMFVIISMRENRETLFRVRHTPEEDLPAKE